MFVKYVGKNIDYTKNRYVGIFLFVFGYFSVLSALKKEKSSCFWVNCLGIGPSAVTS
jgi:hypothetical protein